MHALCHCLLSTPCHICSTQNSCSAQMLLAHRLNQRHWTCCCHTFVLAQILHQLHLALTPCAAFNPSSTCVPCHMFSTGSADTPSQTQGIEEVIQEIVKCVSPQPLQLGGPFKFAIDHCFAIRGQGTVLTGTVLSGAAKVGDSIELPELKVCAHRILSCHSPELHCCVPLCLTSSNLC